MQASTLACGGQKEVPDLLELELQAALSHSAWGLGTEEQPALLTTGPSLMLRCSNNHALQSLWGTFPICNITLNYYN